MALRKELSWETFKEERDKVRKKLKNLYGEEFVDDLERYDYVGEIDVFNDSNPMGVFCYHEPRAMATLWRAAL